jgi:thiosulfate/3-mercaptopyruvate sulfurtransferase
MPSSDHLPVFLNACTLNKLLSDTQLIIVDLGRIDRYRKYHLPNALWLDYACLISGEKPATGLLPTNSALAKLIHSIGLKPDSIVVAYDDLGGGASARLIWLLNVLGFYRASSLDGGIQSWVEEGFKTTADACDRNPSEEYQLPTIYTDSLATKEDILDHLFDRNVQLVDCRSVDEFTGIKKLANRGGHIPGAINLDWNSTKISDTNQRLKNQDTLISMISDRNLKPDLETIVYCQTHHRSSHSYLLFKHLGFNRVRGYAGSWSEWGNDDILPITT